MNKRTIIYHNKSLTNEIEISIDNDIVLYKELAFLGKELIQSPVESIDPNVSFSRIYHLSLLITSIFITILSSMLIIKKWNSGEWTLYLGMIVVFIVMLGYTYYFFRGIKYGEVEFCFGNTKRKLYMTKKNFWEFKEKITHLINCE